MQTRSFRGSGEPAWVIASSNACDGLGPDPRRALGPAAIRAASTGRTHDRTRPMLHQRKKALVNQAPSTHDPQRTWARSTSRSAPAVSRPRRSESQPARAGCSILPNARLAVGLIRALESKKGHRWQLPANARREARRREEPSWFGTEHCRSGCGRAAGFAIINP